MLLYANRIYKKDLESLFVLTNIVYLHNKTVQVSGPVPETLGKGLDPNVDAPGRVGSVQWFINFFFFFLNESLQCVVA